MDRDVKIAYSEVDKIISLMDQQFQDMIPKKLRELIYENKISDYDVSINPNIPLNQQTISRKALSILAVLNYNYWCTDTNNKEELIETYRNNERIKEEELRKLYNPDNLFKNKISNEIDENDSKQLIIYNRKDNFLLKIINKIKKLLKIDIN